MKLMKLLLLALFFIAPNAFADGPYYVSNCAAGTFTSPNPSCANGSDTNDGLSPSTPFQTFAKIQNLIDTTTNGRTIRLARGGKWATATPLGIAVCTGTKCTATNPLIIEGYTPSWGSSSDRWIIEQTADLNILKFEDGGTSEVDHGYIVRNGHLHGTGTTSVTQACVNFYNDVDDVIFDDMDVERCADGFNISVGNGITPGDPGNGVSDRITIKNSNIHDNIAIGILGGCNYCVIENNHVHDNGWGSPADKLVFNHNIYVATTNNTNIITGMRVVLNRLENSAQCTASTPTGTDSSTCTSRGTLGKCDGVPLVVHGRYYGLVIEGNRVDESAGATGGCYGIQVDPGYASEAEYFNDVVMRGNTTINVGNNGMTMGGCQYCVMELNEAIWTNNDALNKCGFATPDGGFSAGDQADSNITMRNNTVRMDGTSSSNVGICVQVSGSNLGQRIFGNAVFMSSNTVTGASCYKVTNMNAGNFPIWDYNQCYSAGASPKVNQSDASAGLFSAWNTAGWDQHGQFGADPKIDTPTSGNSYSVKPNNSTSPLRNNGHPSLTPKNGARGAVNPDTTFVGANPYNPTVVAPIGPHVQ